MEITKIKWNDKNLIPAIIQDYETLNVLMLGYMNEEAINLSIQNGQVTFFSRSKNRLWTKGETSGNKLLIKDIKLDCDNDTILIKAKPLGPTCHQGTTSCFKTKDDQFSIINKLENMIETRMLETDPNSYTSTLIEKGIKEISKKLTEEAGETSISAVTNDGRLTDESADLVYHLLVLLKIQGLSFSDVTKELERRNSNQ
jgi:phosphoribosyl-ATP pyrophosphohydrolase/phosphoribosyl-AMP cyclohydrolase